MLKSLPFIFNWLTEDWQNIIPRWYFWWRSARTLTSILAENRCSSLLWWPPHGPVHGPGRWFTPVLIMETLSYTACSLNFAFPLFTAPQELKAVLLGSGLKCFPLEWRSQAFTFSEMHDLRYGIVQKKVVLTTQLRINTSSLWSGFQRLSCLCFNFLGWSLWSSGICPSLCTENASVRMPPRHWYWPSVSYLSILLWPVQLTPPCSVVTAWMPFTDISSHQWLRYSTAKYWPLLGGISMLFTQLWLCSQEVKTFQHHQKKMSCESCCWNPLEGWRGKTGHSCHVRLITCFPRKSPVCSHLPADVSAHMSDTHSRFCSDTKIRMKNVTPKSEGSHQIPPSYTLVLPVCSQWGSGGPYRVCLPPVKLTGM